MKTLLLLAIAAFTMGAEGCNSNTYHRRNTCVYFHYPPCREVYYSYDCPCISYPNAWDPSTVAEIHTVRMDPEEV